jgi:hypothetical protein
VLASAEPTGARAPTPRPTGPAAFTALGGVAWTQTMIAPPVTPAGESGPLPAPPPPPPFAVRDRLRARHHRLVGAVARRWGLAHRVIHRELADRTGGPLAAASFDQLRARLALLESWLSQGFSPPSTARSVR